MTAKDSIKSECLEKAKNLRKRMTHPEHILWRILRAKRFAAYKFRRQHPIEHFIVDFASCSHRLIIEIDGPYHDGRNAYDDDRSQFLQNKGFTILRFTNDDVYEHLDKVKSTILSILQQTASRTER